MKTSSGKYIAIHNLVNPERAFERLDNEFVDVMYTDHIHDSAVIMVLDVNIDPLKEEDRMWLKELLDTVLPELGETTYFLTPFPNSPS
jgi:Flp pilus assembly CpaE family ATPase